jgi:predicted metal-dependent enzyme (double-stranded beta helix superfamily)
MSAPTDQERCRQIKNSLSEHIGTGGCPLDDDLLASVASQYGRRLLYKDPAGIYTVVLMIWDAGQGTPIHDHAGIWCVDCVCLGNITVESYAPQPSRSDGSGLYDFDKVATIKAGMGEAGALIPPFEYHTIHNHSEETAATVHVYGGELAECNIFVPQDSGYRLEVLQLSYSD